MRFVVILIVCFAGVVVLMALFERSLIFFPTRYPEGFWDTDAVARGSGCTIEDRYFSAEDGVRLHGWWCRRVAGGAGDPVVLFFHGNAGNLSDRAGLAIDLATRTGAEVFLVGYRGYGRSEGRPNEGGLYLDARAAWSHLTEDSSVEPGRIVIFGKSLGGAVAVDLASWAPAAGLIVESSFTSVPDMARTHYPFVPRFMIRTQMDSLAKIPSVSCPKLFIHSRSDEVVPYRLGRRLFEAADDRKRFHDVDGAGHNETAIVGGDSYFEAIRDFVANAVQH